MILTFLKNPLRIITSLNKRGYTKFIPDKLYLKIMYKAFHGKKLNLENPKAFTEKLQWLKLYDRNPKYTEMTDKYAVRGYVKDKIGEEYLIPLIGVYDSFDDIDFDSLPKKFVMKCTHDSGSCIICDDKKNLDISKAKKKLNRFLKRDYYWKGREYNYHNIASRIVIEQYMCDELGAVPNDYKFFTFDGKVKLIQVDIGRYDDHCRNFYTPDWEFLSIRCTHNNYKGECKKPQNLLKMLELAEILSQGIPHVRVDFYSIGEKIYFGELTFHHGSGEEKFYPKSTDNMIGDWLKLPSKE